MDDNGSRCGLPGRTRRLVLWRREWLPRCALFLLTLGYALA